jgi:iron(III) transport system substrate-binding protein
MPRLVLAPMVAAVSLVALMAAGCRTAPASSVVVYTSVDQPFAEPVLAAFEARTGIAVEPVYDVEAAKTTGLVNRLLAEKDRPRADVWWSGEFAQTVRLADAGMLDAYTSPSAGDIPGAFSDPAGRWTGFGGRARVVLVNTDLLKPDQYPTSIDDLAAGPVPAEQIGLANPVFGTAATQAAALFVQLGEEGARRYYEQIRDRGVRIVDGNSVVRDMVADGRLAWGIADTDDACGAVERGAPVAMVFPDQDPGGMGTLVIPNTVGLVAGGPNPTAGKAFIDFLLEPATTADLVTAGWFQLPLRAIPAAESCVDTSGVRALEVPLSDIAAQIQPAMTAMAEIFVR